MPDPSDMMMQDSDCIHCVHVCLSEEPMHTQFDLGEMVPYRPSSNALSLAKADTFLRGIQSRDPRRPSSSWYMGGTPEHNMQSAKSDEPKPGRLFLGDDL